MTVFMIALMAYLLYVSYCKIVCLCFRGKLHNRFFATFINTVIPVFGSIPAFIMVSKYEKRVGCLAPKMNGEFLRGTIIALQMASVFVLFLPFLKKDGIYADGINFIYGLNFAGEELIPDFRFLSYLVIAPFVCAVINSIDIKYNIRNILTYIISLLCMFTVFVFSLFFNLSEDYTMEYGLWVYCAIQITTMLFTVFSLIKVRNGFLLNLEQIEREEMLESQKKKAKKHEEEEVIPDDSYRCAKCGSAVLKGTICSCRQQNASTLNSVMVEQNKKETSDFCVYCRKALKPGETCDCMGDGFGITVKPEQYNGRKCSYCGKILVGDTLCVCEKIMNNSAPASSDNPDEKPKSYFEMPDNLNEISIADEMAQLEDKISLKFSNIKNSLAKKGAIDLNTKNDSDSINIENTVDTVGGDDEKRI
ncbi:MAG: hypothetical protein IJB70_05290 [Clostridia bacterium]|nr:hypothetical protein [Clostridia bacterium]